MLPPRALLLSAALLLATAGSAAAQTCPQLSAVYSATIAGTTTGASADSAACGGASAPEATVFYTAPRAGTYVIDTIGSAFDTVLYVRNAAPGTLCNDDIDPPDVRQSRLSVALQQGQMITIVVDGFDTESGAFILRINGNCPQLTHDDPRDLGAPASLSLSGTTALCASFLAGGATCADPGDSAPDAVFLYTAPFAGDFFFDTIGSGYDTLLALRQESCAGMSLGCNDDIDPPTNKQSALSAALVAGQTVLIAVDGFESASGPFTLNIHSTPASPTPTRTRTATPTRTRTATRTASRTASPTGTATRTRTVTSTRSTSPTAIASFTASRTRSSTATRSGTATRTRTATATGTVTTTPTRSTTGTATATSTPSATASSTATSTLSATATQTAIPTASTSASATATPTTSVTPSLSATPTVRPPNAPSDLSCRAELGTVGWVIHLEWVDNSSNETEFHIERAADGVTFMEIATVPTNETMYVDGPVDAGVTLAYRVRGHRHATDTFSDYSNVAMCATAVPTSTATALGTATPTVTRTATSAPAGPAFCRATRFGGIACKIDFEHLPDGSAPRPFADVIGEQYLAATGVSFPGGGWVVRPSAGTSSPDLAFLNASSGGEQEFNGGPMHIDFTGVRVKRLAVRVGLDQRISGAHAVLTAFDETGTRSVSTTGTVFADGPTRIDQLIEVRPSDFAIARAELLFDGDTPSARNAVEVIDDLVIELDGGAPCPPGSDSDPPVVTVFTPFDGQVFNSRNLPEIRGVIEERSGTLTSLRAEVVGAGGSFGLDLSPYVRQDAADPTRFAFAARDLTLFDGANDVTVRAGDAACPPNRGETSSRVTFEAPPPDLNFYAFAIEITQNLQDVLQIRAVTIEGADPSLFRPLPYGAAMPLVAGKLTAVRAYAGMSDVPALLRGVPAELRLRRGADEVRLVADPISIDPADTVLTDTGLLNVQGTLERKRADFIKGWYFILPLAFTQAGQIDALELHVNPPSLLGPVECTGCNDAANVLKVANIPFRTAGQLAVKVLLARDTETNLQPSADAGPRTLCDSLHKTYPVREGCGSDPAAGLIVSSVPATYSSRDWVPRTDTGRILRDLACKLGGRGWRDNVYHQNLTLVEQAGVLNQGFGQGLGGSGCGVSAEADWPTAAHEIGHSWLLCHLPCGSPPDLCSGLPRGDGQTGDEGFHTSRFNVLPRTASDWMSYCNDYSSPPDFNTWVSAYVYRYLRGSFERGGALRRVDDAPQQAAGDYLSVAGHITNGQTGALDPLYRLTIDDPEPASEPGPYELALLDANGGVLYARSFAAERIPEAPGLETFHELIPFAAGTQRVVLRRGTMIVAERVASASAPSVAIDAPQGGESWAADEEHAIAWTAGDADGDPLVYLVQYSRDDGATWQTIAVDLLDAELAIDVRQLPGAAAARVRVLASDGLHTATAESERFEVARKERSLVLSGVTDQQAVLPGTVLALRADYIDVDGEVLVEADFVWRSDAAGVFGTGSELDVVADSLPPGQQVISVTIPGKIGPPLSRSATILRVPRAGELSCPGDCDGNGAVVISELVRGVRIALGETGLEACVLLDTDRNAHVTVNELILAVGRALNGCGGS